MTKSLLAAAIFILGGSLANAQEQDRGGLFVEPMVTYSQLDGELDFDGNTVADTEEDIEGFGAGVRVGGHVWESMFLALDGRYSKFDFAGEDTDAFDVAGTLGFQTPIAGLRVWGSYIFDGKADPDSFDNGVDAKFTGLTGYRVGVGFYYEVVSINLEYQDAKYHNTKVDNFGGMTFNDLEAKTEGYILSVSFPIAM